MLQIYSIAVDGSVVEANGCRLPYMEFQQHTVLSEISFLQHSFRCKESYTLRTAASLGKTHKTIHPGSVLMLRIIPKLQGPVRAVLMSPAFCSALDFSHRLNI